MKFRLSLVSFLRKRTLLWYFRLKLLQMFCEGRIEIAFNELDSVREISEYGSMQNMQFSWGKLTDSLLQMDAIAETRAVNSLLNRLLAKMYNIQAVMPLFVNADVSVGH